MPAGRFSSMRYAVPFAAAAAVALAAAPLPAKAAGDTVTATVYEATEDGKGDKVGTVSFSNSEYGLLAKADLENIDAGAYGFHIHQNAACGPGDVDGETVPAGAAGGHLDPEDTGTHQGPYGQGHLGDMPNLMLGPDGTALPVAAPRLEVEDVAGHAVMIHAKVDHYGEASSAEEKGGGRAYCGVIQG